MRLSLLLSSDTSRAGGGGSASVGARRCHHMQRWSSWKAARARQLASRSLGCAVDDDDDDDDDDVNVGFNDV